MSNHIWKALVIALLIQGCSGLASQTGCSNDLDTCMYECSATELQMFDCRKNMGTVYIPPLVGSQSFCCRGYFKTSTGVCQKCRDHEFMPRLNNCCRCELCKDCDRLGNDTIKELCTSDRNTVCWIETDSTRTPGSTCPTETPPTISAPPEIEPTGASASNSSFDNPVESTSNKRYVAGFYVLLASITLLAFGVSAACCYLCRLGEAKAINTDEMDSSAEDTWEKALLPLARKMRKSISCIRRGQPVGQPRRQPTGESTGQSTGQHEFEGAGSNNSRRNGGQGEPDETSFFLSSGKVDGNQQQFVYRDMKHLIPLKDD